MTIEAILLGIGLAVGFGLYLKIKSHKNIDNGEFAKEEARIKVLEEISRSKIEALKKEAAEKKKNHKNLTPEEIENWWKNEDND